MDSSWQEQHGSRLCPRSSIGLVECCFLRGERLAVCEIGASMTRSCSVHTGSGKWNVAKFCLDGPGVMVFYALTAPWNVEYMTQDRFNNGEIQLRRSQSSSLRGPEVVASFRPPNKALLARVKAGRDENGGLTLKKGFTFLCGKEGLTGQGGYTL